MRQAELDERRAAERLAEQLERKRASREAKRWAQVIDVVPPRRLCPVSRTLVVGVCSTAAPDVIAEWTGGGGDA